MRQSIPLFLILAAAACSEPVDVGSPAAAEAQPAEAVRASGPGGAATVIRPETTNDSLQWAASVVQLDSLLPESDAKVFGLAGGDPALNGTQTYLAFYLSPAEGWRVFGLGDWRAYDVTAKSETSVTLRFVEDSLAADQTTLVQATREMRLAWRPAEDGTAPETVSATVSVSAE